MRFRTVESTPELLSEAEGMDKGSGWYKGGEYTEIAAELALTAGSGALRTAAARASRAAVRAEAAQLTRGIARNGMQLHHINPLFGHPGGAATLFPTGGLPASIHSGSWNLQLVSAAQHAAAHRRLRQLEWTGKTIVNPPATAARAARNGVDGCGCNCFHECFSFLGLVVLALLGAAVLIMLRDRFTHASRKQADGMSVVERLQRPQFDDIEAHFRSKVPVDLIWLYRESNLVEKRNVHLHSELEPEHEYEIDHFLPADVKNVLEVWFPIGQGRFPFAIDKFGNYFFIEMKPEMKTTVFYADHDGGSVWPVAHSLRSWLGNV